MITRWAVIGVLAASSLMPAAPALGNEKHGKLLRDSAAALSEIDPDLFARLRRFADEKAQKKDKKAAVKAEDVRLIRDSAAALRSSRPELAKELESMADHKARKAEGKETAPADETAPPSRPGY